MKIGPTIRISRAIKGTGKAHAVSVKRTSPSTFHMSGSGVKSATSRAIKLFKIRPS